MRSCSAPGACGLRLRGHPLRQRGSPSTLPRAGLCSLPRRGWGEAGWKEGYLGSVQPLQLLLLGLPPRRLLHAPCQLGAQLLLRVSPRLGRTRHFLGQVHTALSRWHRSAGAREPGSRSQSTHVRVRRPQGCSPKCHREMLSGSDRTREARGRQPGSRCNRGFTCFPRKAVCSF